MDKKNCKIWWFRNWKIQILPTQKRNIDINKILVSDKVSFGKNGFKYFIGLKDDKKFRPLYILLPKQSIWKKFWENSNEIKNFMKNVMKLWENVKKAWEKDLIVNLYTMKKI